MKKPLTLTVPFLLAACAGIRSSVDFDPTLGFREYETYEWAQDAARVEASERDREVQALFEPRLRAMGYEKTVANADFWVHVHLASDGIDFPAAYRRLGYRPSRNMPINLDGRPIPPDAIVFDVVDRRSRELVWRSVATRVLDAETGRFVRLEKGVDIVMRGFPPP